jgi:hypothetical protein
MVKKKKYPKALLLLICIFLTLNYATIPTYAQGNDPMDEAFPKLNSLLSHVNDSDAKFLNSSKYYLDIKSGKIIDPLPILNNAANTILKGIMGFVTLLIYLVILSFKIKIFDEFSGILESVMKPLKIVIFDQWLITAILIFAFWMLLSLYFTSKRTNIYKNIIAAAIIIGIALGFLNDPTFFLNKMNDMSQYMCNEIIEGSFNKNYKEGSTDGALVTLGNQIWETMVEQPWKLLEFGSQQEAKKNMNEMLKYDPTDDERIKIVEELAETNALFTSEYSYKRLGFVIFYAFAILPMLLVLLIIAGLNIGFQFMVMFFALWAPVVFILSIIPSFGMNTFLSWFSKEAGFFIIKIALTMFMAILFVFHNEIFNLSDKYGFILVILIQTISTIMVVLMRKKILGFATSVQYGQNGVRRSINSKNPIVSQAKSDARNIKRAGSAVATIPGARWAANKAADIAIAPVAAVAHPVSIAVNKAYDKGVNMYEQGVSAVGDFKGNMSRQIKNRKIAKEYLWTKYDHEKSAAEQKAKVQSKKLGREVAPNYNSFVKEKMNLEKMNARVFSNREINAVAKELQHIQDHGGSVDDLFKTIKNPEQEQTKETQRPSNINMKKTVQNKGNVGMHSSANVKVKNQKKNPKNNENYNSDEAMNELAKEFLQRQFELNKNKKDCEASERAKMMGISQKPEYDAYTSKVIGRMKKMHNRFSKDEIGKAQSYLEHMKMQGADLNDYMENMPPINISKMLSTFDKENETENTYKKEASKERPKFNIKNVNKKTDGNTTQTIGNSYTAKYSAAVAYEGKEESQESLSQDQLPKLNISEIEKNGDENINQTVDKDCTERYSDPVSNERKEEPSKEASKEEVKKKIPKVDTNEIKKRRQEETQNPSSNRNKENYTGPVSYDHKDIKSIQSNSIEMENFIEKVSKGQKELSDKIAMDEIRTRVEKMNKEFNDQFKTNQTEEFFENIIQKYGMDKVNAAVKEIKKYSSKENASSRLLKALKEKKGQENNKKQVRS